VSTPVISRKPSLRTQCTRQRIGLGPRPLSKSLAVSRQWHCRVFLVPPSAAPDAVPAEPVPRVESALPRQAPLHSATTTVVHALGKQGRSSALQRSREDTTALCDNNTTNSGNARLRSRPTTGLRGSQLRNGYRREGAFDAGANAFSPKSRTEPNPTFSTGVVERRF
jgi:hypothetical protein